MDKQNKEHHDLNDVCHRLDKLVLISTEILQAVSHQHAHLASIDKHVASIDEKTPTPPDIGVDGGTITTTQKD